MPVYEDCRHYLYRSTSPGEGVRRCRLSMAAEEPFACPEGCLFHEPRSLSGAGWTQGPAQPMTNTAAGLDALPPPKRRKPKKKRG